MQAFIAMIGNMAKDTLSNRPKVLAELTSDLEVLQKNLQVLKDINTQLTSRLDENKPLSPTETTKLMRTLATNTAFQAEVQSRLVVLTMIYVSGDNCSADAAKLAMKCGHNGSEMLTAMLKAKLG